MQKHGSLENLLSYDDYWINVYHLRMGEPVAHLGTRSQDFNAGSVCIVWLLPQD